MFGECFGRRKKKERSQKQEFEDREQCSYKSVQEFQSLKVGSDALLILHVNAGSLTANKEKLEKLIERKKDRNKRNREGNGEEENLLCDIICVSDTCNPQLRKDVQLPGYNYEECQSNPIPKNRKGGVAIYVNNSLQYNLRKDLQFSLKKCENLWLEITPPGKNPIVVGAIYLHDFSKSPFSQPSFTTELEEILRKLKKENKTIYICGDINVDLLKKVKYRKFLDKLKFKNLITKPTREKTITRKDKTYNPSTLIDHIYTTDDQDVLSGIIKEENGTQVIADHYPIFCIVKWQHKGKGSSKLKSS